MTKPLNNLLVAVLFVLIIFDVYLWFLILTGNKSDLSKYYFLDIGQGDSELLVFRGGVKLLIDGGPNKDILSELSAILPANDRYIDLVMMTHPQLDHMGGLVNVLKIYEVGAFLGSGRKANIGAYEELMGLIRDKNIPYVQLLSGDNIKYQNIFIEVISPEEGMLGSPELNDTSLVIKVTDSGVRSIFTGDIDENMENDLVRKYDLDADILKVGHHGSRMSTGANFLAEVTPKISVIEVGKNKYGHPTNEALDRLKESGSQIFRTDIDGTIKLTLGADSVSVAHKK